MKLSRTKHNRLENGLGLIRPRNIFQTHDSKINGLFKLTSTRVLPKEKTLSPYLWIDSNPCVSIQVYPSNAHYPKQFDFVSNLVPNREAKFPNKFMYRGYPVYDHFGIKKNDQKLHMMSHQLIIWEVSSENVNLII